MTTFSPTDAALEGFRLARERPRLLGAWALVYLVVSAVLAVLLVTFAGDTLMELRAAEEAGVVDEETRVDLLMRMLPISLLGIVVTTVFTAAVYRAILRPEEEGRAYLRLGGDELRLILLALIFIGLIILFVFVLMLVLGIAAALAGASGDEASLAIVALIGLLASLALMPMFVWVWVRLSLAWPMTFAERRLRLFESWTVTRGHFWRLFGAYLLAGILALVITMLGWIIYAAVAAIMTGGDLAAVGQVFEPDMSSAGAYFTPAMIVYMAFAAVLGPLQYLIMFAPGAVAYQHLAAPAGPEA